MLFNSLPFLFFFVLTTLLYFLLPHRARWVLLLAASCYFYMAFVPVYILILLFTIVVDYAAGLLIEKAAGARRRFFLILSLCSNIGFLAFFKYYGFFNANLATAADFLGLDYALPALKIILPIGLSFHTFQAMAYTVEVYRGRQQAERHLGIFALYVLFYPQLVAGPIERPQHLIHQLREKHAWDWEGAAEGLRRMAWGFFKKVVIADRLAFFVKPVFAAPADHGGLTLWIALHFFAFQIYCDFSGYSDIAIGAARVLGIRLMENFRTPYFSRSLSEFWTRWHISLSTWFRDYLYIPLGGSRVPGWRWVVNISIVFLISGLWHGASWTFVFWGALHGFYLVTEKWITGKKWGEEDLGAVRGFSILPFLRVLATYHVVLLSWVFFRAGSFSQAWLYLTRMFGTVGHKPLEQFLHFLNTTEGVSPFEFGLSLAVLAILIAHDLRLHERLFEAAPRPLTVYARPLGYAFLVVALALLGVFDDGSQFIYFQF